MPAEYKIELGTEEQKGAWDQGFRPLTLPYDLTEPGEGTRLDKVLADMEKPDAQGNPIVWRLVPGPTGRVEVWRKGMRTSYNVDEPAEEAMTDSGC